MFLAPLLAMAGTGLALLVGWYTLAVIILCAYAAAWQRLQDTKL